MKARTTVRSDDSGQEMVSKTATVVTPPAGAHTSAHQRPSVASPSSTPRARHSWASRSAGVAGQSEPRTRATGESSLIMPSSRTSPTPGRVSVNDGVITVSCSATSRASAVHVVAERTSPCQPSRSVEHEGDPRRTVAAGLPVAVRAPQPSRAAASSGSRSGHSAVSTGTDRNGPLTSISLQPLRCAWPRDPPNRALEVTATRTHRIASRRGTAKITATGKLCGVISA